jgi:hypothetical protein
MHYLFEGESYSGTETVRRVSSMACCRVHTPKVEMLPFKVAKCLVDDLYYWIDQVFDKPVGPSSPVKAYGIVVDRSEKETPFGRWMSYTGYHKTLYGAAMSIKIFRKAFKSFL